MEIFWCIKPKSKSTVSAESIKNAMLYIRLMSCNLSLWQKRPCCHYKEIDVIRLCTYLAIHRIVTSVLLPWWIGSLCKLFSGHLFSLSDSCCQAVYYASVCTQKKLEKTTNIYQWSVLDFSLQLGKFTQQIGPALYQSLGR